MIYHRDCHDGEDPCGRIGVKNAEVAEAIATAVEVFGWELLTRPVVDLVTACAFTQVEGFVHLTEELVRVGKMDAAECVARTALGVFETRIGELESQIMAERTCCAGIPDVDEFLERPERRHVKRGFKTIREATQFADFVDKWLENQKNIKRWRLEQGKFMVAVLATSLRCATKVPQKWRQPKSKRQRVRSICK